MFLVEMRSCGQRYRTVYIAMSIQLPSIGISDDARRNTWAWRISCHILRNRHRASCNFLWAFFKALGFFLNCFATCFGSVRLYCASQNFGATSFTNQGILVDKNSLWQPWPVTRCYAGSCRLSLLQLDAITKTEARNSFFLNPLIIGT